MDRKAHSIELDQVQLDFLLAMQKKHMIPDLGKTIRCMVNYAMQTPKAQDDIWKTMRCTSCG